MADLGVRTLGEVVTLAATAARLTRTRLPALVACFCFGWAGHELGLFFSALLGADHAVLANLTFVLAVVVKLASLVLMVHVLRPGLRLATTAPRPGQPVPDQVYAEERTLDVLTLAVGPFLAVYAVWGFIDDEVSALFRSNYLLLGAGDVQRWSISVGNDRLTFYLLLAAAGWLLRAVVRLVLRRRPGSPIALVGVLAEGVWAFGGFLVLLIAARIALGWLRERVIWVGLSTLWHRFVDLLPDLTLPFGPTLRELVLALGSVAPGAVSMVFLLPLMWLALAATVYGWRDYQAADVVAGTRVGSRWARMTGRPAGPGRLLLLFATADLRTKYLPVAQALRLIGRAGPRFVGAYLLLATTLSAVQSLLTIGLSWVVGPRDPAATLLIDPLQTLLVGLVVSVASVALYAAAFDQAVAAPDPNPAVTDAGR